jgi:hypothetical protein
MAGKFKVVGTLVGSPPGDDLFEPHMPQVNLLDDIDGYFAYVKEKASGATDGKRHLAIVTPRRMVMQLEVPAALHPPDAAWAESILGSEAPLDVSVVSHTYVPASDTTLTQYSRSIPFLGLLLRFAHGGHTVVVFEGHPSAFAAGVRGSSVLLVDSGMVPFLQEDWAELAYSVMRADARVFVHDRQRYQLSRVSRGQAPASAQPTELDGEASYLNCLLTTMAKAPATTVELVSKQGVPDLAGLTRDRDELDWISRLPFRYDTWTPAR